MSTATGRFFSKMARSTTGAAQLRAETLTDPKTAQIKFRLSGALNTLVEKAASANGWKASEEIRRRLAASFLREMMVTNERDKKLLDAIEIAAENVEPAFGRWDQDRFAFDVFRAAVEMILDLQQPPGDAVRPTGNDAANVYLGEDGTAQGAGKVIGASAFTEAGIPLPGRSPRT